MLDFLDRKKAAFADLGITTDWHCHLLPGVDDGVQNMDDSISILRSMRESGIRTVVHTPHFNSEIYPDNTEPRIKEAFDKYIDALPSDIKESMTLRLAGEYMVTEGFEYRDMTELFQIAPGKVLIEMSYMYPSPTMEQTIFNLQLSGLTPVIAHPERYLYYSRNLEIYDRFHDMGAEFQLNLLSLGGVYGPHSRRIMDYLLKHDCYTYTGTDTHSANHFNLISSLQFKQKYLEHLK